MKEVIQGEDTFLTQGSWGGRIQIQIYLGAKPVSQPLPGTGRKWGGRMLGFTEAYEGREAFTDTWEEGRSGKGAALGLSPPPSW